MCFWNVSLQRVQHKAEASEPPQRPILQTRRLRLRGRALMRSVLWGGAGQDPRTGRLALPPQPLAPGTAPVPRCPLQQAGGCFPGPPWPPAGGAGLSTLCRGSPPPRCLRLSHRVPRTGLPAPGEVACVAAGTQEAAGSWPRGLCSLHCQAGSPHADAPSQARGDFNYTR